MANIEKEKLLKEMDRRTHLWEAKRDDAKRHIEIKGKALIAKIDLQVAEDALVRIEAKKKEIRGEGKSKTANYVVPAQKEEGQGREEGKKREKKRVVSPSFSGASTPVPSKSF